MRIPASYAYLDEYEVFRPYDAPEAVIGLDETRTEKGWEVSMGWRRTR